MIHIASTYVADVLCCSLKAILRIFSDEKVCFHYNQIFQQTLSPHSAFYENKDGLNVILIRSADLFSKKKNKTQNLNDLIVAIHTLQKTMKVPLLIILTPTQTHTIKEKKYYSEIENDLKTAFLRNINTIFISSEETQKMSQVEFIFDPITEKYGHIPYTLGFYETLAMQISRKYSLFKRKPHKVIVLDCDGTLWNGVVEEDGIHGLVISEEFLELQQFMIDLFHAGFLLCLCSKNSEKSILNVFQNRKEMILDMDKHICSYRINWHTKSSNIKSLSEELNLGLESFIFIDDNHVECAEVKANFPEILTIHLPLVQVKGEKPISRVDYLKKIWAFDVKSKSFEDEKRTEFYKQNRLRHQLKSQSNSYKDFLKNLNIKIMIREAGIEDAARVIQLSQRTNQFNLFPNMFSEVEFNHRMAKKVPGCFIIHVADKYGDYGLVGAVVYNITNEALLIQNFFLSCRVLGREVEYTVMNYLMKAAEKYNKNKIKLLFKVTDKNIPAMEFIQHLRNHTKIQNEEHITLLLSDIKKISPRAISLSQNNRKMESHKIITSNDYMLDIAKFGVQCHRMDAIPFNQFTTVEMSLIELLKQYKLPIDDKNKDVPLIHLGIDSMTSVFIASAIFQRFHIEIIPFELLKSDFTFCKLIQYLERKMKKNATKKQEMALVENPCAHVSLAQLSIWEDEQIFPGTSRNHMFVAYEIEDEVNIKHLEKAFIQLMARHDALRFSIVKSHGEPRLKLNSLRSLHFKIEDFESLDVKSNVKARSSKGTIFQYVENFRQKPFDLSQAPLFRVSLVKENEKSILLFCIHHIIHDGWSLNILIKELSNIYDAYSRKVPLEPFKESFSYLDFIKFQQDRFSKNLLDKQRTFWEKQLSHIPKLDLVYDKTRKEEYEKPHNHRIPFKIGLKVTQKLKQISVANNVTLYDVTASIFGLFLSHYANQNDINFVTAASGRHHPNVVHIIGLFTSLVLIRMSIEDEDTLSDLLKKNKKILDDVFQNQDLPFHDIVELTGESVNSKIHAFNQAGFIFQSYPINHLIMNGKICQRVFADDAAQLIYDACDECRFGNLVCFMQEHQSELQGVFEYNTTLFEEKRIKFMIDTFKMLLKYVSDAPEGPIRSIPLLSKYQHNLLMYKWNQPKANGTGNSLLHYFYEQVTLNKNALAVVHNEQHLTYGELDQLSNQLARKLLKEGVSHEIPIGIFLENNLTRIVAVLGITKAGGCYVPLEKDLPAHRINNIIKNADICYIITDSELDSQMLHEHYPQMKCILIADIESESNAPVLVPAPPSQLLYIMYTSGSTGNPKGIKIEQNGVLRLVKSPNYIEINPSDGVAQASSFLFDAATFEIWGALLNGATLVLVDKKTLLDAHLLNEVIFDKKISILFLTTPLFHAYVYLAPFIFQNLKYLLVGGETISEEAVSQLFSQRKRPKHFLNVYGPTENTTFSTAFFIKKHARLGPTPIGKPITGTQVYVLNQAYNLAPIGAPGKLYLGGIGLAREYVHQDILNQEKFINYFGERLYDTGDMVIWNADGNLNYLGRKDNQVKINGYRVELGEIETQLKAHHEVEQAIVLVKNEHYHRQLVAYVLLKPECQLHTVNLHHHLKTILPQYMLPKFYYQIETVPLTAHGKIDKKTLLKQAIAPFSYSEYASPKNTLQKKLIHIYSTLLHILPTEISIYADFFDLGGNSISALHLIDKINRQFKIKLNFSDIYESASVSLLSEKIIERLTKSVLKKDIMALKLIKEGDSQKTPIVFMHPVGGSGYCYLDLIKLLPKTQPCYMVQDPSIDSDQILFKNMQDMASYYNELLVKTFNNSKFILAGYSFGGMLSLEMVSQLERQKLDKYIHSVILFDTWVISNFLNAKAKEALRICIMKKYKQVENELIKENIDPKPWMEIYYRRLQNLGFAYKPPVIDKKIILFKASQQINEFSVMNDATNYLNAHTSAGVDVYSIPGTHDSILQYPHVKEISQLLTQYLK